MSRITAAGALFALGCCLAAVPGTAPAIDITPLLRQPDTRMPVHLLLSELPPAPCPFELESAHADDTTLVLRLAHADACPGALPSTELEVQPRDLGWGRSGVVRVRVEDLRGPGGSPRLLGFGLVEVGRITRTAHPEAGYWWNESGGEFDRAGPGLGLNLERQGDTLSVTVLGYADDGRPEWLFGAGPIEGRVARVPLSRLQDGAGPFTPWQAPGKAEAAGVVHFDFLSGARATAWFERQAGSSTSLHALSLVRFRFDEQAARATLGTWLVVGGIQQHEPPSHSELLTFDRSERTEGGFRLLGDDGAPRLDCTLDKARANSPAARCVLADAEGRLLVDFQDIALGRMRGWRPDGVSVTALHRPAD